MRIVTNAGAATPAGATWQHWPIGQFTTHYMQWLVWKINMEKSDANCNGMYIHANINARSSVKPLHIGKQHRTARQVQTVVYCRKVN